MKINIKNKFICFPKFKILSERLPVFPLLIVKMLKKKSKISKDVNSLLKMYLTLKGYFS